MKNILVVLVALSSTGIFAQNKPSQQSEPSWIEPTSYSTAIIDEEDQSGYYYLLSDKQAHLPREEYYVRTVVKVLNGEGVSQLSDLSFEFDPTYEQLVFHKINVLRDGEIINKLNLNSIQTVQRESNFERKLYDGRLTSLINLLDIRAGDILDYSYSINGDNPVYKGGYSSLYYFQYGFPVGKIAARVITDASDKLEHQSKNGAPDPEISITDSSKVFEWQATNVAAKYYDSNTPLWYDDYPYVYLSNYGSWENVVTQYAALYELSSSEKQQLKSLTEQNLDASSSDIAPKKEDQVLQLINFVQDDIRYFGFEGGLNSHKPESPLKVLNQRYGDCKGKSFLLAEMLNNIGVEAYPMLVNSGSGKTVGENLPTPNAFNHCVVNYKLNGNNYYVDPTIANQGGDATTTAFPNYEKGLILKKGEKALIDIPRKNKNGISIQEIYDLDKVNGGAALTVVTTYKGGDADNIRADVAQRSTSAIQKDYINFYSILYPTIKVDDKLEIDDSPGSRNEIVVRESYQIDSVWQKSPDNEKLIYFEAYPLAMESYISTTKSPERTAPYHINFPLDVHYDITVNLPEEWALEKYTDSKSSEYFNYDQNIDYYLQKLLITHKYSHKKDFIAAKDVNSYIADHKAMQDNLSYFITYDLAAQESLAGVEGVSWVALFIALLALGLSIFGAYKLYYQYDVEARDKDPKGKSIGGWLILIAIGLIFTPLRILYDMFSGDSYFDAYTWTALWATEGLGGKPLVFFIGFELFVNIAFFIFSIILIILFFERRTIVPRLMIFFYGLSLVFVVFDTVVASVFSEAIALGEAELQDSYGEILKGFVRCAIWIPYFTISERVKETFVKRAPGYTPPPTEIVPDEHLEKITSDYDSTQSRSLE